MERCLVLNLSFLIDLHSRYLNLDVMICLSAVLMFDYIFVGNYVHF